MLVVFDPGDLEPTALVGPFKVQGCILWVAFPQALLPLAVPWMFPVSLFVLPGEVFLLL